MQGNSLSFSRDLSPSNQLQNNPVLTGFVGELSQVKHWVITVHHWHWSDWKPSKACWTHSSDSFYCALCRIEHNTWSSVLLTDTIMRRHAGISISLQLWAAFFCPFPQVLWILHLLKNPVSTLQLAPQSMVVACSWNPSASVSPCEFHFQSVLVFMCIFRSS